MRSSVSVILSNPAPEIAMSHPDYEQTAHDHGLLLVLVKQIGSDIKPKLFNRVYDRICHANRVKINDSSGNTREISARFIKEYPVENNDWGDFQTHRRLLGIISVGKCTSQVELNEICRVHESLKVKYINTLFESRCIFFGIDEELKPVDSNDAYTLPSNFKTRAHFYPLYDSCQDIETIVTDFISSLFWILESKREEKSREKVDKVSLMLAPFEKKDFIGLDLESRANRKKCVGRMTKHLGDLSLQCGLLQEALNFYQSATDTLRSVNDWLWLGGSLEGQAAASAIALYPHMSRTYSFQRNSSLQDASVKGRSVSVATNSLPAGTASVPSAKSIPSCLPSAEIPRHYREAILHYSKYQNAGIIETEACFKGARISIEQGAILNAATVLQNVVFINLQLSEQEKIVRFTTLADLYRQIGFNRKASFCSRLAATRYVSLQNPTPDWTQCYHHMLQAFAGHKLSLDPTEFSSEGLMGWASLQVQLLQELVVAARRMDHPALATRHMTFLLQTLWTQLSQKEQRDFALQLQGLSSQCEGSPVPLVLGSGLVIPPANLTNIPLAKSFEVAKMPSQLRPQKLQKKEDSGPFLFTPINFNSLDRRGHKKDKVDYLWVEGDVCDVNIKLFNPLDFELVVTDVRLLTNGVVFESIPISFAIPPETVGEYLLTGIPKEAGDLEVLGYSTHTLGVKSNCKLKYMKDMECQQYTVEVIPAMPRIGISTSMPSRIAPTAIYGDSDFIAAHASFSLYAGECSQCNITISNNGEQPLEMIEISMKSILNAEQQAQTFQWDCESITNQLPISPGQSASFTLNVHAAADFLVPNIDEESMDGGSQPPSLSGPTSLPSQWSSPAPSRVKDTPSFRSTSSKSGGSIRLPASPVSRISSPCTRKTVEGQLKIRYSGGPGLEAGYCRTCSVLVNLEIMPSIQITGWDVLPAETNQHFYLVLDMANMTNQELEVEYTMNKSILMEANEPCRIPIPLPRCPLDKLPALKEQISVESEMELERVCSDHIASLVELLWKLPGCSRTGKASLSGISLAPDMLHIVMVSPLHWDVTIDGKPVTGQEAATQPVGKFFTLGIQIQNMAERPLRSVALIMDCYQDYRNGSTNHAMDTRMAFSGADSALIDLIDEQKCVYHEYRLIFFNTGHYKIGMTCTTQENLPSKKNDVLSGITHSWKLIPAIDINVSS